MTTDVKDELREFEFGTETVKAGDRFHLDHADGQVVIVITDVDRRIKGIATNSRGDWCGPWGRIIFYKPIQLGEVTDATFNQSGGRVSRLEVIPTKLVRVRGPMHQCLLG